MTQPPLKLTLISAILININIMLGSGIFINTVVLTKQAGSLGAAVYLLVALLLLPLILAIAQLLEYHPDSGTFYDFGKSVSPYFGFLSSWSYFTAKLCSSALSVHVCLSFLQQLIPMLQVVPLVIFDCLVIALFASLNLLNLRIGKSIQYSFTFLKLIPIFFVLLTGLFFISGAHFNCDTFIWSGIPLSIPLVLYAYSGFEASCSLSSRIKNARRNGPLAIFISFAAVVTILFLFQLLFYGTVGMSAGQLTGGYLDAFPAYINNIALSSSTKNMLLPILYLAIASSSLGSAYGIMYSNSWNLYTLAHNNHTFGKKLLAHLNVHGMPAACVVAEGALAIAYILITQGNQIPLQQVSALGGTISYTFSSIALLFLCYKNRTTPVVPILSLLSCALLFGAFIWTIITKGPTLLLLVFLGILSFGSFMFYRKHQPPEQLEVFEEL